MKANFAMLALFHTERPLQFVKERDGANQAFVDLSKNPAVGVSIVNANNPHLKNTPDYFMFRHGYMEFVSFWSSIHKIISATKTTNQRKNAFGGACAS